MALCRAGAAATFRTWNVARRVETRVLEPNASTSSYPMGG